MRTVFFDTSALYSAIVSPSGAARELMRMAINDAVTLYISEDVVTEATRNISNKAPQLVPVLAFLLDVGVFILTPRLNAHEVQVTAQYVEPKDAMIVAAAIKANVTYLATFDRKHLIDPPAVSANSSLNIATPGDILQQLR